MIKKQKILIITLAGIIATCIAPYIFTQCHSGIIFEQDSGSIGDTIGGTTAPVVGIVSIVLLCLTLVEQKNSNKRQQLFTADEQFKSTLFNLLQTQRYIAENMKGNFSYLMNSIADIQILERKGLDFFTYGKEQLRSIYAALECEAFYSNYKTNEAKKQEAAIDNMTREYEEKYGADILPYIIEGEKLDEKIEYMRVNYRFKYINDAYSIKKGNYDLYKKLPIKGKIKMGYIFLLNKYEGLSYYFKHLCYILKFIKSTEEERKANCKGETDESKKKEIHAQFKQYAQFVQAQMSTDELLLLYYHSFVQEDLQELIIQYDVLENFAIQNLIMPGHYCNAKIKLKDKEYIQRDLDKSTF